MKLKYTFHPKNKHRGSYDLIQLCQSNKQLQPFIFTNKYGAKTIDFSNPNAVKELNRALLISDYQVRFWDFPDENLCPPIPGRVDYVHYLADLLKSISSDRKTVMDIGTGASCIYPILGLSEYNWNFIATDVDIKSLNSAKSIIKKNGWNNSIELRLQKDKTQIFKGIIKDNDHLLATMCNPPFYRSALEAQQTNQSKQKSLGLSKNERNFAGTHNELWFKGGEKAFLHTYLYESSLYKESSIWFTALVSKKENIKGMYQSLEKLKATQIKTIPMYHGNKITRIVAWSFITDDNF